MSKLGAFHSSWYSIEHAKRHIRNLETEVSIFFSTNPYSFVTESNADGTEDIHKIKLTKPMPAGLSGITFDAINNLRSSLDQAGYAVAVATGRSGKNAHFPFGDTAADVNACEKRRSKHLPKQIFDLMVSFKPYRGGNDLLWAMNKLCNSQKHELIIPVATYTGNMDLLIGRIETGSKPFTFPPRWNSAKNEMVIAQVPYGSECKFDFQYQVFIAFNDVECILGQPVIPILNKMLGIVDGIVMALEAEAKRIDIL